VTPSGPGLFHRDRAGPVRAVDSIVARATAAAVGSVGWCQVGAGGHDDVRDQHAQVIPPLGEISDSTSLVRSGGDVVGADEDDGQVDAGDSTVSACAGSQADGDPTSAGQVSRTGPLRSGGDRSGEKGTGRLGSGMYAVSSGRGVARTASRIGGRRRTRRHSARRSAGVAPRRREWSGGRGSADPRVRRRDRSRRGKCAADVRPRWC
jgi:hypothetical protein